MARLIALYNSRTSKWVFYSLFAICHGAAAFAGIKQLYDSIQTMSLDPELDICQSRKAVYLGGIGCGSTMVFQTIVFLLTAERTWGVTKAQYRWRRPSLTVIVFRDGFIYYILMTLGHLFNFLVMFVLPSMYHDIGQITIWAVVGIVTPRLMLNLREAANAHIVDFVLGSSFNYHTTSVAGAEKISVLPSFIVFTDGPDTGSVHESNDGRETPSDKAQSGICHISIAGSVK